MAGIHGVGAHPAGGIYSLSKQQVAGIVLLSTAVAIAALTLALVPGVREVIPLAGRVTLIVGGIAVGTAALTAEIFMRAHRERSKATQKVEPVIKKTFSEKEQIFEKLFPGYVEPPNKPTVIRTKQDAVALLKPDIDAIIDRWLLFNKKTDLTKTNFTLTVSKGGLYISDQEKNGAGVQYTIQGIETWMYPIISDSQTSLDTHLTPPPPLVKPLSIPKDPPQIKGSSSHINQKLESVLLGPFVQQFGLTDAWGLLSSFGDIKVARETRSNAAYPQGAVVMSSVKAGIAIAVPGADDISDHDIAAFNRDINIILGNEKAPPIHKELWQTYTQLCRENNQYPADAMRLLRSPDSQEKKLQMVVTFGSAIITKEIPEGTISERDVDIFQANWNAR